VPNLLGEENKLLLVFLLSPYPKVKILNSISPTFLYYSLKVQLHSPKPFSRYCGYGIFIAWLNRLPFVLHHCFTLNKFYLLRLIVPKFFEDYNFYYPIPYSALSPNLGF